MSSFLIPWSGWFAGMRGGEMLKVYKNSRRCEGIVMNASVSSLFMKTFSREKSVKVCSEIFVRNFRFLQIFWKNYLG
jgi:hypothetical protein